MFAPKNNYVIKFLLCRITDGHIKSETSLINPSFSLFEVYFVVRTNEKNSSMN